MDISKNSNVASRKRMITQAAKLRGKVAKRVQGSAYKDLKEKLKQLEANYERLQQNIVQMQYQTITGQRQEELPLRPDTHNFQASRAGIDNETLRRHAEQRVEQLQDMLDEAKQRYDTLNKQGQESSSVIERLQVEVAVFARDKKEREQKLLRYEAELHQAKDRITSLEVEREKDIEKLNDAVQRCQQETDRAEQLARRAETLQEQANKALQDHAKNQAESERRISELQTQLSERTRELDSKADTITLLIGYLKTEAEARSRSETNLNTTRQQYESERSAGDAARADLSATIQRLENTARAKDEEISVQKTIIQDIRAEKERLLEHIRALPSTNNNIQQDMRDRAPPPAAPRDTDDTTVTPEVVNTLRSDDNIVDDAVDEHIRALPSANNTIRQELRASTPAPAAARVRDNLRSDGSADSDALDALEVNRRFEALARGDRHLPPLTLPRPHGSKRSLSQAREDPKLKTRKFFKSRVISETKTKK